MSGDSDIARRKADHVEVVLGGGGRQTLVTTGLEAIRFEHNALPGMHLHDVSLETSFLGKQLKAPLLISSMTGGHAKGAEINRHLAEAAERNGIAFAVGSQRVAIEGGPQAGLDRSLREAAPSIPIYANLGAAQIGGSYSLSEVQRAIDMIEADALIVHLNSLQETVQIGGDHDWSGVLGAIERLARGLGKPVIVKEVGFGISGHVARQLKECGVAAIDVAGAGGTNWALAEAARSRNDNIKAVTAAFAGWGIPTATALHQVQSACTGLPLIGSGGVKTGVDVAAVIRLGGDIAGIAAGLLEAAVISTEAVDDKLSVVVKQLQIACFCTGSRSLAELRKARLLT